MALPQPLRALRAVRSAEAGGTPPISAERAALAEAIARLTEMRAQLDATATAIDTARPAVWEAMRVVDAAPELVETAKANAAIYLQQQARGLAPERPQTIREARNAVADAQDTLDTARAAVAALEAEMDRIRGRLPLAEEAVRRTARAVLHVEAEATACALAAELAAAQRALVILGDTVEWLAGAGAFTTTEQHGSRYGLPEDDVIRMTLTRLQTPPRAWNGLALAQPAAAVWIAAFAALQADATASLPVVTTA